MRAIVFLVLFFVSFSVASYSQVTKAGSTKHLSKWTLTSQIPNGQEEVTLGFALKQNNLDVLDSLFWSVSDPTSEKYGKHLSNDDLANIVGSDEDVITSVRDWLESNNAKSLKISETKDYIWATFTHSEVEALLHIELAVYEFLDYSHLQRAIITRSENTPSVPSELASKIDFISGVWNFPATGGLFKRVGDIAHLSERSFEEPEQVIPYILEVVGLPNGLLIYFIPICSQGNESEVIIDPCSDYGNPIVNYTVTTTQYDYNTNQIVSLTHNLVPSLPNYPNCTIDEGPFGDLLYCIVAIPNLLNDVYVNSTFSYCYQDKTCTDTTEVSGGDLLPVVPSAYLGPNDVRAHYQIPTSAVGSSPNNSQAVSAFIYQFFSPADLAQFFKTFGLPPYTVQKVVGPNNPPFPGDEASLDIQYIMGIGQGVNSWFWSMGGNDWIAEWAQAVVNTPNAPWVHSISYGESESDVDTGYLTRAETELQKLGVTGRSVMVASGDDGTGDDCDATLYDISWPASSPHVTAVGATRITRGATPDCQLNPGNSDCSVIGEVSASYDLGIFWTTGGGFSTVYLAPSYQQSAINAYLSKAVLPPQKYWNKAGRAYPDVSAVGHYLQVVDGGVVEAIDGTSAASPIFAGTVSLLNEARIQAGKGPLGFLNPWIYSIANLSAFYDVTVGDTTYCGDQGACCPISFVAAQGWDPASGLGTPIFPVLLKQALTLP